MNTTDLLSIATAICPEREAMVFEGKRWSYFETGQRVNRLSNALSTLGVGKGDRIAMLQVNCPQAVELYFAVARLGAIFVPLNFRAKIDELVYMLEGSEPKILFVGERYLEITRQMLPRLPGIEKCFSMETVEPDMPGYDDLLAAATDEDLQLSDGNIAASKVHGWMLHGVLYGLGYAALIRSGGNDCGQIKTLSQGVGDLSKTLGGPTLGGPEAAAGMQQQ